MQVDSRVADHSRRRSKFFRHSLPIQENKDRRTRTIGYEFVGSQASVRDDSGRNTHNGGLAIQLCSWTQWWEYAWVYVPSTPQEITKHDMKEERGRDSNVLLDHRQDRP